MKSNGHPIPPGFNRFESIGHDKFTAKLCYSRCSRPPEVDGIKIFDKDEKADRTQNTIIVHYFTYP